MRYSIMKQLMSNTDEKALYFKQASPAWLSQHDSFWKQRGILSYIFGFKRVTADNFPLMHESATKLASHEELSIKKPLILIFKNNIITWLVEQYSGYAANLRSHNIALTKNISLVIIGNGLVKSASSDQLEATIARELAHIKMLHTLIGLVISTALVSFLLLAPRKSSDTILIASISLVGLVGYFLLLSTFRLFQSEADLIAARVIDDPRSILDVILRMPIIQASRRTIFNTVVRFISTQPLISDRVKYLKEDIDK